MTQIELPDVGFLIGSQKETAADHNKNGYADAREDIVGIGNQPASGNCWGIAEDVRGRMKQHDAEGGKNAKQIQLYKTILCSLIHENSFFKNINNSLSVYYKMRGIGKQQKVPEDSFKISLDSMKINALY